MFLLFLRNTGGKPLGNHAFLSILLESQYSITVDTGFRKFLEIKVVFPQKTKNLATYPSYASTMYLPEGLCPSFISAAMIK